MSIFSVGTGALNAAQVGILTTSHNISNASTPGYNRQTIVQGTNSANLTGSGYIGSGTNIQTVKRIYDQFLSRQVLSAEAGAAEMDSYLAQANQIDNLLADSDAGISPVLSEFFEGVQEVAANPSSVPARQALLSAAESLAARFQALDQRMQEMREGVNSQVQGSVTEINAYSSQIAEINQRIILAEAGSSSQVPNDLYDQREQMIRELNQIVRVSTVTQSDGSFNVFIGQGQPLVVGSLAYQLAAVADPADPEKLTVAMKAPSGATVALPESQITGGSLGGLLSFRSDTLDSAQNSLGRIAIALAQDFNDQHELGMDLTGQLGSEFFSISDPVVRGSTLNTGTGTPGVTLDVTTLAQLTDSDYRLSTPDGVTYQLTRLSDNTNVIPLSPIGGTVTVDGFTLDLTGWSPSANDSFTIQPTRTGARNLDVAITDPRAIAAAAPIRTSATSTNTGSASIDAGTVVDITNGAFTNFATTTELAPPLLIQFDTPTTYSIWDNTDPDNPAGPISVGNAYTPGANLLYPGADPDNPDFALPDYGYEIKISGTPATGDSFSVGGNKNGVSDNRNAQLLGALQTASTMLGGATYGPTASYQSAYSQIVSQVGSKTAEVEAIGAAQQGLADEAISSMQQISGVNLDEEAANLLRYQQAYQAAAKILEVATAIFDEIIALGR